MVFVIVFGTSFGEWVFELSNNTSDLNSLSPPYWSSNWVPYAVVTIIALHVWVDGSNWLGRTFVVNICAVISDRVYGSVCPSRLDSIRPMNLSATLEMGTCFSLQLTSSWPISGYSERS